MKLTNRRHAHQTGNRELTMTSMIDVVFLLLIFFLVTTSFVNQERQLDSGIKLGEQESSSRESDLEPAVIDIFQSGSHTFFRLGAISTSELSELKRPLEQFRNKNEGAFVRVADDVPFERAAQAIGLCKSVGFHNVAYSPSE